jgi:enamine deaminase RidA (YjgF/YER057c/UK114 family)
MKTNIIETSGSCRIEVRASKRPSFTEYHITATIGGESASWASVEELFSRVYTILVDRGVQPIQEKLYGMVAARSRVLKARDGALRAHGLDRYLPMTWLQGGPLGPSEFAGLQIWGVASSDGEPCVRTVENPATGRGRLWEGRGFQMLYLPSVIGTLPSGRLPSGACDQAQQVFKNIGRGLDAHGFRYNQVVRTWIYVARLLDWYGDLNRVRTAHYKSVGLGVEGGPAYPASTGIQCFSDDEECLVDVLALETSGPEWASATPVRCSPRQDQSFNYGSAFSRGMVFDIEGKRTVHISGTASINTAGMSTHLGDAECQSLETMMSIAAILEQQGGSLRDITSATLFCKDRAAYDAWCRVSRLLQVPEIPKVCVIADVCRDNLLVEMESVAVI